MQDYCLFNECKDESWQIGAEICLCFEEEKIAEIDSKITAELNRCCSGMFKSFRLYKFLPCVPGIWTSLVKLIVWFKA